MILILSSCLTLAVVAMGLPCVWADVIAQLCPEEFQFVFLPPPPTKIVSDEQPGWENVTGIDFVACSQC